MPGRFDVLTTLPETDLVWICQGGDRMDGCVHSVVKLGRLALIPLLGRFFPVGGWLKLCSMVRGDTLLICPCWEVRVLRESRVSKKIL